MTSTTTHVYRILGMSCNHCRSSVTEEVEGIDGVGQVQLDLDSGRLTLEITGVTTHQVRSAVERAGYEMGEVA